MKYQSLLNFLFLMGLTYAKSKDTYYDEEEILANTGWKGVSIQENAPLHLSVISQGTEIGEQFHKYDKNYYYPSSAGNDTDIYIIDTGFNFTYPEFNGVNATCEKIIKKDGNVATPANEKVCNGPPSFSYHGSLVSSAIAGKFSGVAKNARIHGIVFEDLEMVKDPLQYLKALITGLKYLLNSEKITSHKTVINISSGTSFPNDNNSTSAELAEVNSLFNKISEKGGVIVAGAGNEGIPVHTDDYSFYPCAFDSVICVGGVGLNKYKITEGHEIEDVIYPFFYNLGDYDGKTKSNHGDKVDLYSPFLFHYASGLFYDNYSARIFNITLPSESEETGFIENYERIIPGTSLSTPIVSGVIATLMSEFPERKFTTESVLQYLKNQAIKKAILDLPANETNSNLFLNNGKTIVYNATLTADDENIFSDDEGEVDVQVDLDVEEDVDSSEETDSTDKQ